MTDPGIYVLPPELDNYDLAKQILSEVFYRIRDSGRASPTYADLIVNVRTLMRDITGHHFEIKLHNVLGRQDPSKATGGAATFLNQYFRGMDRAARRALFSFVNDALLRNIPDGVRIVFHDTRTGLYLIGLTNRQSSNEPPNLFHLTIPFDGCARGFAGTWRQQTVHFTNERTRAHQYYKIGDLTTEITERSPVDPRECGGGGNVGPSARQAQSQGQGGNTSSASAGPRILIPKTGLGGPKKPTSGGRRRSTRRRPRRALRKTRKAYI